MSHFGLAFFPLPASYFAECLPQAHSKGSLPSVASHPARTIVVNAVQLQSQLRCTCFGGRREPGTYAHGGTAPQSLVWRMPDLKIEALVGCSGVDSKVEFLQLGVFWNCEISN